MATKISLHPVGAILTGLVILGMWALAHSWGVVLLALFIAPMWKITKNEAV